MPTGVTFVYAEPVSFLRHSSPLNTTKFVVTPARLVWVMTPCPENRVALVVTAAPSLSSANPGRAKNPDPESISGTYILVASVAKSGASSNGLLVERVPRNGPERYVTASGVLRRWLFVPRRDVAMRQLRARLRIFEDAALNQQLFLCACDRTRAQLRVGDNAHP